MDVSQAKENIPLLTDSLPNILAGKMAANQTPRAPLTDLKQVSRPCSDQKVKCRSVMPLHTPGGKRSVRKIKPATLVYREEKENENSQKTSAKTKKEVDLELIEVDDKEIEEFVSDVLQKCVEDIEKEIVDFPESKLETKVDDIDHDGINENNSAEEMDGVVHVTPSNDTDISRNSAVQTVNETKVEQENVVEDKIDLPIHKSVTFDTSVLTDEVLLADISQNESFSNDSFNLTKFEEELLAPTPVIEKPLCGASKLSTDTIKSAVFTVQTPKVNFLERVALTERVNKASNFIDSFVMKKEELVTDLQMIWKRGDNHVTNPVCVSIDESVNKPELLDECLGSKSASAAPIQLDNSCPQNIVDVKTVACSPMPVLCNDAFTQKETETQTSSCSPIRLPVQDSAVQNVIETKSVMCTPIKVPVTDCSTQNVVETQSVFCSPMLMAVSDVSTQNEVEVQSVMCSPMVPNPSHDKSVLVSGPDVVDLCVGTDQVDMKDEEVSVKPDTTTTSTEMDDAPMISCGTTMTPLKIGHKHVKKLTAEDIRKQHPRVLANELETLKTQNRRLESQVLSFEQDKKRLISQEELLTDLQTTRSMLEDERDLYWKQFAEWKAKCEDLEAETGRIRTSHEIQISELKADYESRDYYERFISSQKLVGELQTELQQYKELLPDLQQSQTLIADLKKQYSCSFEKLKTANEKVIEKKAKIYMKESEIMRRESVLVSSEEDIRTKEKERQDLTERISQFEKDVTQMKNTILDKDEELKRLKENNTIMQSQLNGIVTLKKTIELRENDIDMLEKDLFECRELIYSQMEERKAFELREKTLMTDLKTCEIENNDLKDCLARLRAKEQEVRDKLSYVQEELVGTKDHASRMIKQQGSEIADCSVTIDQLADHMTTVLAGLKQRAGIQDITEEAHSNMNNCTGITDALSDKGEMSQGTWPSKSSFVSQILNAVATADTEEKIDQEGNNEQQHKNEYEYENLKPDNQSDSLHQADVCSSGEEKKDSPRCHSRRKLGFSNNSAFAPIKTRQGQDSKLSGSKVHDNVTVISGHQATLTSIYDNSENKINTLKTNTGTKTLSVMGVGESVTNEENKLSNQMTNITEMFQQVLHVAHLIEKALRSSLHDLRSENFDINCKVSQCEYSERRVRAELEVTQGELENCQKKVKMQQATIDNLSERFEWMLDNQSEAEKKDREREIQRLRKKVQALESENEVLNEQMNKLLERMQENGVEKTAGVDVDAQKEIIILKKKVDKYRLSALEKDEMMDTEKRKTNQQVLKLEGNWKRADAEVIRLYKLIDRVRSVLVLSKKFLDDPDIQGLLQVIDCVETDSGDFLKPIKTSRW